MVPLANTTLVSAPGTNPGSSSSHRWLGMKMVTTKCVQKQDPAQIPPPLGTSWDALFTWGAWFHLDHSASAGQCHPSFIHRQTACLLPVYRSSGLVCGSSEAMSQRGVTGWAITILCHEAKLCSMHLPPPIPGSHMAFTLALTPALRSCPGLPSALLSSVASDSSPHQVPGEAYC